MWLASMEMGPQTGNLAADTASNMIRLDKYIFIFEQILFVAIWRNSMRQPLWRWNLSRPQRVPEGTRLFNFQITTRTLHEKFLYSTE